MPRKIIPILSCLAAVGLVFALSRVSLSKPPGKDRILEAIISSRFVALRGNVHPMVLPENDQGPVEDSFRLENMTLVFKPSPSQQAELASLRDDQQNPHSPNFHQWLTPEQYADRFGMSPSDLEVTAAWLEAQGFTVTHTARSRNWISFTGTAASVQAGLHTEIHRYLVRGQTYYANATEPSVPTALADVVLGIGSLHNYRPKPRSVFRQVLVDPQPDFTSRVSGKNFLAPDDFAIIYDVKALYSSGFDGTGQTIAVMGQTDFSMSDVTTFRSVSGLPVNNPTVMLIPGSSDPGSGSVPDVNEALLDLEWSGAVARNAHILFVNSTNAFTSLQYAVSQDLAPVISISYGTCEPSVSASDLSFVSTIAQQANSQGITIVSASGDQGAADCDYSSSTTPVTVATQGLAIDVPGDLPYVTSMGGTEFNDMPPGSYWLPATGTSDVSPSALSYIPEIVWNDTSVANGLLSGGGGVSAVIPKPSWQVGTGVPADGRRDVPDISLNASPMHDGYLVCSQGACLNGFRNTNAGQSLTAAGGTSVGAPTFAGIVALINQKMGSRQGNVNPRLYALASTSPSAFHDVISGNNIVPCQAGSPNCPASPPLQFGYTAGVGYDLASGLGSIDAFNLVTAWSAANTGNLPAPTLTAPANGATGVPVPATFSWSAVTGNAGYRIMVATSPGILPTSPSVTTCGACTIVDTASAATYTSAAGVLAGNTLYYWQVQAIEPSSSSGAAAWSSVFIFNTIGPDFSLSAAPTTLTMAPGTSATSTLTLTPSNGLSPSSVTFACTVAATLAGVTCTVGSLNASNAATVTITASSTALNPPMGEDINRFRGWPLPTLGVVSLLLIFLLKLRLVRAPSGALVFFRRVALAATLAGLLAASLSCGGGSNGGGGGGTTAPPPEGGTVTVQGTAPNTNHTFSITVNVT